MVRIGVALAVLGVVAVGAYKRGVADCEAAHNAELLAQIEAGEKAEKERLEIARERDELARQLEEEAYAEPVTIAQCLGPSRLRRLNDLR